VANGRKGAIPALITSARISKSLDADQRMKRYLWSMTVRVVCFIAACLTPFPANILLIAGAAIIPGIAVILANAIDMRVPVETVSDAPGAVPALTTGVVVQGGVEDAVLLPNGDER